MFGRNQSYPDDRRVWEEAGHCTHAEVPGASLEHIYLAWMTGRVHCWSASWGRAMLTGLVPGAFEEGAGTFRANGGIWGAAATQRAFLGPYIPLGYSHTDLDADC